MNRNILTVLGFCAGAALVYLLLAMPTEQTPSHAPEETHAAGHDEHEDTHGHGESGNSTIITPAAAQAAGINVVTAGPVSLTDVVPLTGKIILNPETTADIKARFPGVVRSVRVAVGDAVRKGQVLATVESNDSLQTYAVTSPLNGVITQRHASLGDATADNVLFVVANLATALAEFHVFAKDLPHLQPGQTVRIRSADNSLTAEGRLQQLLPTADLDTQSVLAWVRLENTGNLWRPGMAVQGGAITGSRTVPVGVDNAALQTLEGQTVVFVSENAETYGAQAIKTGQTDGQRTEVLSGLAAGTPYVNRNSFVVKADIGKAGAGHDH